MRLVVFLFTLLSFTSLASSALASPGMGPWGSAKSYALDPSTILNDTLYEASPTAIASHTVAPGPGGPWTLVGSQGMSVSTSGAYADGASLSLAVTDDTMTNGYVELVGSTGSTSPGIGFGPGRINSSNNGYSATLLGSGTFYIRRIDSGTPTTISNTATCTIASTSTPITIRITFAGSSISAEAWDGSTSLCTASATDSTYSSGPPAIRINASYSRITQITAVSQ